eukprot:3541031-Rhodomonas_salina.5
MDMQRSTGAQPPPNRSLRYLRHRDMQSFCTDTASRAPLNSLRHVGYHNVPPLPSSIGVVWYLALRVRSDMCSITCTASPERGVLRCQAERGTEETRQCR